MSRKKKALIQKRADGQNQPETMSSNGSSSSSSSSSLNPMQLSQVMVQNMVRSCMWCTRALWSISLGVCLPRPALFSLLCLSFV